MYERSTCNCHNVDCSRLGLSVIITIIVVVLAGAVIRWVRAGEREIRSSEERRPPGGCLSSVASLLAGVGAPCGSGGGRVGWLCARARLGVRSAQNGVRALQYNLHGECPGLCHPVVRVRGAGCCGIVWRHGLRTDYPKAPSWGGASAASRGQRYEPGDCRRGARLVDQQGKSH